MRNQLTRADIKLGLIDSRENLDYDLINKLFGGK